MKKKKSLVDEIVKGATSMGGLSSTTFSAKTSSKPLSLKDLEEFFNYLQSDEYKKKEEEAFLIRAMGHNIVAAAYSQNIITAEEALRLHATVNINGMLTVSSKMYKRLEKVKWPKQKKAKSK